MGCNMGKKQCHTSPMTGNGYMIYISMVMTGGWFIIVLPTFTITTYPDVMM